MTAIRKEVVIGNARLLLGDASAILPTLGPIEALATDPPYGMTFRSNFRKVRHKAIANDADVSFLQWTCEIPVSHSAYVWMRWDNLPDIPRPRSLVTWVKNNHSMGDLLHEHGRKTEVCAFYAGPDHVWPEQRPCDVLLADRTGNNFHPTEKPVGLMQSVVRWTRGVVVDPFMGSGTTGVACAKLGRSFVGIELDPDYFEIACKRIRDAYAQGDLFVPQPARVAPVQTSIFDAETPAKQGDSA